MKYLFYLTLPCLLVAETSFITAMEYASQLYKNPRGIGCQYCHGEKGEGKLVANYTEKKEKKSFGGSPINKLEWSVFYFALNKSINGMPRYYLTEKEIQALYLYLTEDKLRQEANEKAQKEQPKAQKEIQKTEEVSLEKEKQVPEVAKMKKEEVKVQKVEPKKEKPKVKVEEPKIQKEVPVVKKELPKMLRYEDYPD